MCLRIYVLFVEMLNICRFIWNQGQIVCGHSFLQIKSIDIHINKNIRACVYSTQFLSCSCFSQLHFNIQLSAIQFVNKVNLSIRRNDVRYKCVHLSHLCTNNIIIKLIAITIDENPIIFNRIVIMFRMNICYGGEQMFKCHISLNTQNVHNFDFKH